MFKTKNYIRFYKGYVLQSIHKELIKTSAYSIVEIDFMLKFNAGIVKSCCEMDYYEINELIVWSFQLGDRIGLELNFREDD